MAGRQPHKRFPDLEDVPYYRNNSILYNYTNEDPMKFFSGSSKKKESRKSRGGKRPEEHDTFLRVQNIDRRNVAAGGSGSSYSGGGSEGHSRGRGACGGEEKDYSRRLGRRSAGGNGEVGLEWGRRFDDGGVRETEGMVLFWKEPACFVQWTPCTFNIEGVTYYNAEQWMMASKARVFNDSTTLHEIMATRDPREQKALGRRVKGFDATVWDSVGYDIVVKGNLEKFRQNDIFLQQLLATGDKILAEASPYDTEWGIGLHASDDDALTQKRWRGKNKLGDALMDVRRQLKEEMYEREFSKGGFPFLKSSDDDDRGIDEDETIRDTDDRARRK